MSSEGDASGVQGIESLDIAAPTPRNPNKEGYDPSKWCSFCKRKGHDIDACRSKTRTVVTRSSNPNKVMMVDEEGYEEEEDVMLTQQEERGRECYFCGEKGHNAANCWEMKKAKEELIRKKKGTVTTR